MRLHGEAVRETTSRRVVRRRVHQARWDDWAERRSSSKRGAREVVRGREVIQVRETSRKIRRTMGLTLVPSVWETDGSTLSRKSVISVSGDGPP